MQPSAPRGSLPTREKAMNSYYRLERDGATVRVEHFPVPPSVGSIITIDREGCERAQYAVTSIAFEVWSQSAVLHVSGSRILPADEVVTILRLEAI